jgi:UDP-N-acetylglucosamine 2-epimerase (non-hydrolysing)
MILVVYATRPEEIKVFPFTKYEGLEFLEVNQSKDLHQGLITPNYKIEENELERFIKNENYLYDAIMVQGDTRTAFRAALYAFESKIPVIHVEAGMRTFDLTQPYPEEFYRQAIDIVATYKYCSTLEATENCDGMYVGQTSVDTLCEFMPKCVEEDFYIVTVHRTEANIKQIIKTLKKMNQDKLVIFAHPNKVGQELKKHFKTRSPLPYKEFVELLGRSKGCISDSGGLQEECLFLDKDFISLREKSERGHGEVYEKGATKLIVKDLNEHGFGIKLERTRSI